jgi:creatinine amidohydrolase
VSEIREWKLAETNLGRAEQVPYEVAVLPIGATEAHNLHLPYGTDTMQVEAIADNACASAWEQGAEVMLLPSIAVGINENTLEFPWTLSFKPTTILQMLRDIVSCLEHHRLMKLLIINGHGGNELKTFLRELYRETEVRIILVDWWMAGLQDMEEIFDDPGEHGGQMETSLMLHLRPDLVELEQADEGAVRTPSLTGMRERWAWIARPWDLLTTHSGVGNPAGSTAEKGAEYIERCSARISELLVEMANAPLDDWYPYESD